MNFKEPLKLSKDYDFSNPVWTSSEHKQYKIKDNGVVIYSDSSYRRMKLIYWGLKLQKKLKQWRET